MSGATSFNVNTFDAIVLGILGLSALVAFFRGFIRELLSLGAWVGAALITLYLFPHSTEFMKNHIHGSQSGTVAAGVGALGTYIAALLGISVINSIILRYVKTGAEVGLLDNFLGLLFGALRGAFIISLGYLIMLAIIPKDPVPDWLKTSVTRSYVQKGADFLSGVAPQYLADIEGFVKKEEEKARQEQEDNPRQNGYNPGTGRSFNQILQGTPSQGQQPYNDSNPYNESPSSTQPNN
jgi:uncharacterized membrane protein required for colicin V production